MINNNKFIFESIIYNYNEKAQNIQINDSQIKIVKKIYESIQYENVHLICNFLYFKRHNEEKQVRYLLTNGTKSIGINFILNTTKINSLDFYESLNENNYYTIYNIDKNSIPLIITNFFNDTISTKTLDIKVSMSDNTTKKEIKPDEEIKESLYEYGNPTVVFKNLDLYVQLIVNTETTSLIIAGQPGVGKTYTVTNSLEKYNADYIKITGRSTAHALYVALYENNGKIILFDDCDKVLFDTDAISILKAALDSIPKRKISWLSKGEIKSDDGKIIPDSFEFTGKCIFITNSPLKKIDQALCSRSMVIEVAFTPEDMLKYLNTIVENIDIDCPSDVKHQALDFIAIAYRQGYDVELSVRSIIKAIHIESLNISITEMYNLIVQQCKKIQK